MAEQIERAYQKQHLFQNAKIREGLNEGKEVV
ncbi:hypothetical protein MPER_07651 [Moniliophthora perniciosa FA553]|nr:hypothetical protein MPER_07651 [Moniliophthora perniciosa FA553]